MIGDHHGRTTGRATPLVKAVDDILGTHSRPHQAIAQRIPDRNPDVARGAAADLDFRRIRRKPVLNGLINEYQRAA